MPPTHLRTAGQVSMPSNQDLNRALFLPAPPKCASRTLVALLKNHLGASVVRHKIASGHGHLVLNVPKTKLHERLISKIGLQKQKKRPLVYGHYPATEHNIAQLKRRYRAASVVIPVRPLGALLCSLIHHTRCNKYGPLDPRSSGLIDGISDFHRRSESELFHLLGIFYIPQIYLLIRSWIEATKEDNIPLFFVPFESITDAQSELLAMFNSLQPKYCLGGTTQPQRDTNDIKANISTTHRVRIDSIKSDQRESVAAIATKLLGCDDSLGELLPYLLSDLRSPGQRSVAPLAWHFHKDQ